MKFHQCNTLYKLKEKNITISLESEKTFIKIQQPFTLKVLHRSGSQGTYLNITKTIYSKTTDNIKFNTEKLEALIQLVKEQVQLHYVLPSYSPRNTSVFIIKKLRGMETDTRF